MTATDGPTPHGSPAWTSISLRRSSHRAGIAVIVLLLLGSLLMHSVCRATEVPRAPHPRLLFPRSAETGLKRKLAADPLAARLQAEAMRIADGVLKQRTCIHQIPDGKRLLEESRLALSNILHTAWAWRLSGKEPYRLRAVAELQAACRMNDWNPQHFLDTAEMATAVAIGYDWLYDTLTPAQRLMCERALVEKALKPAAGEYSGRRGERRRQTACGMLENPRLGRSLAPLVSHEGGGAGRAAFQAAMALSSSSRRRRSNSGREASRSRLSSSPSSLRS